MPHRVFVAVDLDEASRDAIAAAVRPLRAAFEEGRDRRLRWVSPAQWHLTLAFMAALEDGPLDAVREALRPPVAVRPFTIAFAGVGMFPAGGPPRVLWVGIQHGTAELGAIEGEIARRLRAAGIVTEDRIFRPHLTIARWRSARPGDRRLVQEAGPAGALARCPVDHVRLYESHLSSSGPSHVPLGDTPLASPEGF